MSKFIKTAIQLFLICTFFGFGFFLIIISSAKYSANDGIYTCDRNGSFIAGEMITINAHEGVTVEEMQKSFEDCLFWYSIEKEIEDE